jgi:hypothetical protein
MSNLFGPATEDESPQPAATPDSTTGQTPMGRASETHRDPGPWRAVLSLFGRDRMERSTVIAAVAGVLALLVAVLAWWWPVEGCDPMNDLNACATVPETYLGTWKGTVTIADLPLPLIGGGSGTDNLVIRGDAGKPAAEQNNLEWEGVKGQGCSRTWNLAEVREEKIILRSNVTTADDQAKNPQASFCVSDVLQMAVELTAPDTIKVSAAWAEAGAPGTWKGLPFFDGTLTRQG